MSSIRHIWSVLCRESVISHEKNVISLRDVVENLEVQITRKKEADQAEVKQAAYLVPANSELVSFFAREDKQEKETFVMTLKLSDPDEKELGMMKQGLTFPAGSNRLRNIMRIPGMPLTKSGMYWYEIFLSATENDKPERVATLPLEVKLDVLTK